MKLNQLIVEPFDWDTKWGLAVGFSSSCGDDQWRNAVYISRNASGVEAAAALRRLAESIERKELGESIE